MNHVTLDQAVAVLNNLAERFDDGAAGDGISRSACLERAEMIRSFLRGEPSVMTMRETARDLRVRAMPKPTTREAVLSFVESLATHVAFIPCGELDYCTDCGQDSDPVEDVDHKGRCRRCAESGASQSDAFLEYQERARQLIAAIVSEGGVL